MVHLGILDADDMPAESSAWSSRSRGRNPGFEPVKAEQDTRLRYAQQMLVAATLASGAIITVAAVMMLRLL